MLTFLTPPPQPAPSGGSGGATVKVRDADLASTGSYAADPELRFAVGAHETWQFSGALVLDGDGLFYFDGPAGATGSVTLTGDGTFGTVRRDLAQEADVTDGQATVLFSGVIVNGATTGFLGLWIKTGDSQVTIHPFSTLVGNQAPS